MTKQGRYLKVVNALGSKIVRGEIRAGSVLPTEDALSEEFAVGRSAVREGMKMLTSKSLIQTRTSAGTRVRQRPEWNHMDRDILFWRFSPSGTADDISALADLRVAIEPGTARLAAESADITARRKVEQAMSRLWATADDPTEFIKADLDFHRAIFDASANDFLIYINEVVSTAMEQVRPLHTQSTEHNKETLPNHDRVAVAIVKGHHRKAEEAMRDIVEVARHDAMHWRELT